MLSMPGRISCSILRRSFSSQFLRRHTPVMAAETVKYLNPKENEVFIDMTFGAGGHTKHILQTTPNIKIIALDRDPTAYELALQMSQQFPDRIIPLLGKFSELPKLMQESGFGQRSVDGIIFDFGCSSMQFDESDRGFSLNKNGPLDMRMDRDRNPEQPTAADVLSKIDEYDLNKILKMYGEEKQAKKISRAIIDARYSFKKLETTKELADLVQSCFADEIRLDKLQRPSHVATKTFQALRIFVNNELNEINYGMVLAHKYLKIGGKMIAITFHSLEDTIVKRHIMGNVIEYVANKMPLKYANHSLFYDENFMNTILSHSWQQMTKHVVIPKFEEMEENPRSRSAKLRAVLKIS